MAEGWSSPFARRVLDSWKEHSERVGAGKVADQVRSNIFKQIKEHRTTMSATAAKTEKTGRSPGRPPKEAGGRLHLYLRADAKRTMDGCSTMIDAAGPTEIVRVALRHYANLLVEERAKTKLIFMNPNGGEEEVYALGPLPKDDLFQKSRLHIHLSPTAERDLSICESLSGEGNASLVVAKAIFAFADFLRMTDRGFVAVIERRGVRSAYSVWGHKIETAKTKLTATS